MSKKLLALVLLFLSMMSFTFPNDERPVVALVLSGGTLGLAQIGALEVIEEVGIPIDMVIGTSIGSLIGGLYASGYSPGELKTIVDAIDWLDIASGSVSSGDAHEKQFSFGFGRQVFGRQMGLIPDQAFLSTLSRLFLPVSGTRDFDDLPIQFRCVGTDLITGETIVFSHGRIVQAVRASIAFPGVISPYPIDGVYYFDGGITANLPVEIAREMGADIIIAVENLTPPLHAVDDFSFFGEVPIQATIFMLQRTEEEALKEADLVIQPDFEGLAWSDVWKVHETIERGRLAAEQMSGPLEDLAARISETRPLEVKNPHRRLLTAGSPEAITLGIDTEAGRDQELPAALFAGIDEWPLDDVHLTLLDARIKRTVSVLPFESIGYGLTAGDAGQATLEFFPVPQAKGLHSIGTAMGFSTAIDPISGAVSFSPVLLNSMELTGITTEGSTLSVDVDLQQDIAISLGFRQPVWERFSLAPHIRYGQEYSFVTGASINHAFEWGISAVYEIPLILTAGIDYTTADLWEDALSGVISDHVSIVSSFLTWDTAYRSVFSHQGAAGRFSVSFPLSGGSSWYYHIAAEHHQYLPVSPEGTLFLDLRLNSYQGSILYPDFLLDVGGWEGIPGYMPGVLPGTHALLIGAGYRHRLPSVSRTIGMDSFLIAGIRAGNGYTGFPGWDSLSLRYGGVVGIGIDTPAGNVMSGVGLNDQLGFAWYLVFN